VAQRNAWMSMLNQLTHQDGGFAPDQHAYVEVERGKLCL
jgi:hypothetical protein